MNPDAPQEQSLEGEYVPVAPEEVIAQGQPIFEGEQRIGREDVVAKLRENPFDPAPIDEFLASREREGSTSKDTLRVNLELASIYHDAGLFEQAHQTLLDTGEQAYQEGNDALVAEIETLLDMVEGKMPTVFFPQGAE